MNWPFAVVVLAMVGSLLYLWKTLAPLLERLIATRERAVQVQADQATPLPKEAPTPREALPTAVRMIAVEWADPWAREQAMDYYCELFDQCKDWNQVQMQALSDQAAYLKRENRLT
jgi:hypothetical protein